MRGRSRKELNWSCLVLEGGTFGEVNCMQVIPFHCVFKLEWSAICGRCQKFMSGLIIMGIWQVGRLHRWGLGVVPAILYHCKAMLVLRRDKITSSVDRDLWKYTLVNYTSKTIYNRASRNVGDDCLRYPAPQVSHYNVFLINNLYNISIPASLQI